MVEVRAQCQATRGGPTAVTGEGRPLLQVCSRVNRSLCQYITRVSFFYPEQLNGLYPRERLNSSCIRVASSLSSISYFRRVRANQHVDPPSPNKSRSDPLQQHIRTCTPGALVRRLTTATVRPLFPRITGHGSWHHCRHVCS